MAIPTLALDDSAERHGLFPNVVKSDIDGAELNASNGFTRCLPWHHLYLILEHRIHEMQAIDFVRELGYRVFDSSSYEDVRKLSDFPPNSSVRNVDCVHRDSLVGGDQTNISNRGAPGRFGLVFQVRPCRSVAHPR